MRSAYTIVAYGATSYCCSYEYFKSEYSLQFVAVFSSTGTVVYSSAKDPIPAIIMPSTFYSVRRKSHLTVILFLQ